MKVEEVAAKIEALELTFNTKLQAIEMVVDVKLEALSDLVYELRKDIVGNGQPGFARRLIRLESVFLAVVGILMLFASILGGPEVAKVAKAIKDLFG